MKHLSLLKQRLNQRAGQAFTASGSMAAHCGLASGSEPQEKQLRVLAEVPARLTALHDASESLLPSVFHTDRPKISVPAVQVLYRPLESVSWPSVPVFP